MAQCAAIKPNGERCRGIAKARSDWCPAHDPGRSEARQRAASKAARSKPNSEIKGLKDQLATLYLGVLAGTVTPKVATAANQIINTRLRALALERDIREQDEIEARLLELEERIGA